MNRKILYGTAAAVVVAAACASLLGSGRSDRNPAAAAEETAVVASAAGAVTGGAFLTGQDVAWTKIPKSRVPAGAVLEESEAAKHLAGALVVRDVAAGAPLTQELLVRRDEPDFLASVLRPGKRAFTIEVDGVTGGAGLLRAGNRVDVILAAALDPKRARQANNRRFDAAQTLLTDLRVIAVDRTIEPLGFAPEAAAARKDGKAAAPAAGASRKGTVTLEVSPKDVEILTVARSAGQLSLALRSLEGGDEASGGPREVTLARDIVPLQAEALRRTEEKYEVTTYYGSATEPPQM